MPKKAKPESPKEQSERFVREAQKLIDAGELSPTDADAAVHRLISSKGTLARPVPD